MASNLKTVALADLVEDFAIYPRHVISDIHVTDLVRALEAGTTLPPIIVEAESLRIVDGVHRARALRRFLGDEAKTKAEARAYASEAELFLDAARLNAGHGRKLDRHDQVRIVYRSKELGADDASIAAALHVPEERVRVLEVRVATGPAGEQVAVKQGASHLAGRTLNEEQVAALRQMRGAAISRPIREISRLLSAGVVDLTDVRVRGELLALAELIRERVEPVAAEVA